MKGYKVQICINYSRCLFSRFILLILEEIFNNSTKNLKNDGGRENWASRKQDSCVTAFYHSHQYRKIKKNMTFFSSCYRFEISLHFHTQFLWGKIRYDPTYILCLSLFLNYSLLMFFTLTRTTAILKKKLLKFQFDEWPKKYQGNYALFGWKRVTTEMTGCLT